MTTTRVSLCASMGHHISSSPPDTLEYPLSIAGDTANITDIVFKDERVHFQAIDDEDSVDIVQAQGTRLARINSSTLSLVLEPLVDHCFIELPPGSRFPFSTVPDRIVMPASADDFHHYVHLRPHDILNFRDFGVKVEVVVEALSSSGATSRANLTTSMNFEETRVPGDDGEEVQVKSSNVDVDGDETHDDEEDLDSMAVVGFTSGVLRSTAGFAIKETPNAKRTVTSSYAEEDAEPFSTARDGATGDEDGSPSIRASKDGADETNMVSELPEPEAKVQSSPDGELPDLFTTDTKLKRTYGKESSQAASRQSSFENTTPQPEPSNDDGTPLDEDQDDDEVQVNNNTSDPLDITEVAERTAERTMKRKSQSEAIDKETDDDEGSPAPIKKRKLASRAAPRNLTPAEDAPPVSTRKRTVKPARAASPQVIVGPDSDATPTSTSTSAALTGKTPKVLLSRDSSLRKSASKWLKDHGSEILDDIRTKRTHFVCVVKEDHVKTAKVLRSLVLGKHVVTEEWVQESKKAGVLLDPGDYIHPEVKQSFNVDRHRLFHGRMLFFTTTLADKVYMSGWEDIKTIANEAGASSVHRGNSGDFAGFAGRAPILCFGADNSDPDVSRIQSQHGCTVYRKALIPQAIISGELDLENEQFHLPVGNVRNRR